MSEVKQEKMLFVKKFGELCAEFGIGGVESMEYEIDKWDDEFVKVNFEGGGHRKVNVTADSLGAVVEDVMPKIM